MADLSITDTHSRNIKATPTAENLLATHLDIWTTAIEQKSSAGRGSSKKFSLYGIKKLRELILELAVRGKLVPQDANDEPACVLFKRITAEKAQLVKDGNLRKQKALPELSDDEKPFELPNGWEWIRLGELGYTQTGGTPSKNRPELFGNDISFIKPGDILDGTVCYENEGLSFLGAESLGRIAPANSLLMVCIGTIGKCGFIDRDCAFNQQINSITPYVNIIKYLHKVTSAAYFQNLAWELSSSTTIAIINKGKWESIPIAVAPLAEQHRIVAKVDELMSLCDALEAQTEASNSAHQILVETLLNALLLPLPQATANTASQSDVSLEPQPFTDSFDKDWQRVAEHFDTLFTTSASIDTLKQTILQLAVMGKLVKQDPNDEPAAKLLERIAKEKVQQIKEGKIKKQKPLPAITDEEKPFELPQGWEWCRLPDLGELARGKSKHRPRNDPKLYQGGNIPLVQTGDVARSSGIIGTYTAQYNEFGLAQSQLWPKGTLCITIAANIADTGILGFDACFPDSVVGYTPFNFSIPTKYFDYFIRTAKSNLERFAPSTAQKNINLEILSQVLVPCPPAQEFQRVVDKVDELMALCDQLKARLADAQTTQLHLTDAIVEQAV
ncbi:restriction endonuclease subunit S [Shewanella baltica]|uniref:restriction endonuclease subunit S n=1 Tax=Shewanella baltica TaxID=62322 RepID=UPI000D1B572D|nr:restriction endonuclease subunit S [Shewanella baltica]AVT49767.1 restriction endonuclease [Shewanella baltica]